MHTPHPFRFRRHFVASLLSCLVALASTAVAGAAESPLWNRWGFSAGSYFSSIDTTLRADGLVAGMEIGTELDFEDLGLEPSSTVVKFRLDHLFARRHELNLTYYQLDREGSQSLGRDIVFEGEVFPAEATLAASLDVQSLELAYTYYVVRGKYFGLGLSGGIVAFDIEGALAARVSIFNEELELQRREVSTNLPIPMVGARIRGHLYHRLVALAHARFLPSVEIGDDEGESFLFSVGLEFELLEHLRLGVSYEELEIDVDVIDSSFVGTANWKEDGALVYLRAVW